MVADLAPKCDCSNPFIFREIAFFMIFSVVFSKNLDVKKINRTSISQSHSGLLLGYIQGLQIWSLSMAAQFLFGFREMAFL